MGWLDFLTGDDEEEPTLPPVRPPTPPIRPPGPRYAVRDPWTQKFADTGRGVSDVPGPVIRRDPREDIKAVRPVQFGDRVIMQQGALPAYTREQAPWLGVSEEALDKYRETIPQAPEMIPYPVQPITYDLQNIQRDPRGDGYIAEDTYTRAGQIAAGEDFNIWRNIGDAIQRQAAISDHIQEHGTDAEKLDDLGFWNLRRAGVKQLESFRSLGLGADNWLYDFVVGSDAPNRLENAMKRAKHEVQEEEEKYGDKNALGRFFSTQTKYFTGVGDATEDDPKHGALMESLMTGGFIPFIEETMERPIGQLKYVLDRLVPGDLEALEAAILANKLSEEDAEKVRGQYRNWNNWNERLLGERPKQTYAEDSKNLGAKLSDWWIQGRLAGKEEFRELPVGWQIATTLIPALMAGGPAGVANKAAQVGRLATLGKISRGFGKAYSTVFLDPAYWGTYLNIARRNKRWATRLGNHLFKPVKDASGDLAKHSDVAKQLEKGSEAFLNETNLAGDLRQFLADLHLPKTPTGFSGFPTGRVARQNRNTLTKAAHKVLSLIRLTDEARAGEVAGQASSTLFNWMRQAGDSVVDQMRFLDNLVKLGDESPEVAQAASKALDDMGFRSTQVDETVRKVWNLGGNEVDQLNSASGHMTRALVTKLIGDVDSRARIITLLKEARDGSAKNIKGLAADDALKLQKGAQQAGQDLMQMFAEAASDVAGVAKKSEGFFPKVYDHWMKAQGHYAKFFHMGPVPGLAVRNASVDFTTLVLNHAWQTGKRSKKFLKQWDPTFRPEAASRTFGADKGRRVVQRDIDVDIAKNPNWFKKWILQSGLTMTNKVEGANATRTWAKAAQWVVDRYWRSGIVVDALIDNAAREAGIPAELAARLKDRIRNATTADDITAAMAENFRKGKQMQRGMLPDEYKDALKFWGSDLEADLVELLHKYSVIDETTGLPRINDKDAFVAEMDNLKQQALQKIRDRNQMLDDITLQPIDNHLPDLKDPDYESFLKVFDATEEDYLRAHRLITSDSRIINQDFHDFYIIATGLVSSLPEGAQKARLQQELMAIAKKRSAAAQPKLRFAAIARHLLFENNPTWDKARRRLEWDKYFRGNQEFLGQEGQWYNHQFEGLEQLQAVLQETRETLGKRAFIDISPRERLSKVGRTLHDEHTRAINATKTPSPPIVKGDELYDAAIQLRNKYGEESGVYAHSSGVELTFDNIADEILYLASHPNNVKRTTSDINDWLRMAYGTDQSDFVREAQRLRSHLDNQIDLARPGPAATKGGSFNDFMHSWTRKEMDISIPKVVRDSKPNRGSGTWGYFKLVFANDIDGAIDKALYTIANRETLSRADDQFLAWLGNDVFPNLTDAEIFAMAQQVKRKIAGAVKTEWERTGRVKWGGGTAKVPATRYNVNIGATATSQADEPLRIAIKNNPPSRGAKPVRKPVTVSSEADDWQPFDMFDDGPPLGDPASDIHVLNGTAEWEILDDIQRHILNIWDDPLADVTASTLDNINPQAIKRLEQDLQSNLSAMRQLADRFGREFRDFNLHNYSRRYNFDKVLSVPFGYPFWYTRTYAKWFAKVMGGDPFATAAVYRFNNTLENWNRDIEEETGIALPEHLKRAVQRLPFGLENLFGGDVAVPLLKNFIPIQDTLDGQFRNTERLKNKIGSTYEGLYGFGLGSHALIPQILAGAHFLQGDEANIKQALQYTGYLGSANRLVSSLSTLVLPEDQFPGGLGFEPAAAVFNIVKGAKNPALWATNLLGLMPQINLMYEQRPGGLPVYVGTIYDRGRIDKKLADMERDKLISHEVAVDAALIAGDPQKYLDEGQNSEFYENGAVEAWEKAVRESRRDKVGKNLASWLGGPAMVVRDRSAIETQAMYEKVGELYAMSDDPNSDPDEVAMAWADFKLRNSEFVVSSMSRRWGTDRVKNYTWDVLSRIGRGGHTSDIYRSFGLDHKLVNEWYEQKGNIRSKADRERLEQSILLLGMNLENPDVPTGLQWKQAGMHRKEIYETLDLMFPGVAELQDAFYDVELGDRKQWLVDHPEFAEFQKEEARLIFSNQYKDTVGPYYNSQTRSKLYLTALHDAPFDEKYPMEPLSDGKPRTLSAVYQVYKVASHEEDWTSEEKNDWLASIPGMLEYDKSYKALNKSMDDSIALLGEHIPQPLLPTVRPDAPDFGVESAKVQKAVKDMESEQPLLRTGFDVNQITDITDPFQWKALRQATEEINQVYFDNNQAQWLSRALTPILDSAKITNATGWNIAKNDPLLATWPVSAKGSDGLIAYVRQQGAKGLRQAMMLETIDGVNKNTIAWRVIGTIQAMDAAEMRSLASSVPELHDIERVNWYALGEPRPTLDVLMKAMGFRASFDKKGKVVLKKEADIGPLLTDEEDRVISNPDIYEYIRNIAEAEGWGTDVDLLWQQHNGLMDSGQVAQAHNLWQSEPLLQAYDNLVDQIFARFNAAKAGPGSKKFIKFLAEVNAGKRPTDMDELMKLVMSGKPSQTSSAVSSAYQVSKARSPRKGSVLYDFHILKEKPVQQQRYESYQQQQRRAEQAEEEAPDLTAWTTLQAKLKAENPSILSALMDYFDLSAYAKPAHLQRNINFARWLAVIPAAQLAAIEQAYFLWAKQTGRLSPQRERRVSRSRPSLATTLRVYKPRSVRSGL